jgi:hypothetical protein
VLSAVAKLEEPMHEKLPYRLTVAELGHTPPPGVHVHVAHVLGAMSVVLTPPVTMLSA